MKWFIWSEREEMEFFNFYTHNQKINENEKTLIKCEENLV